VLKALRKHGWGTATTSVPDVSRRTTVEVHALFFALHEHSFSHTGRQAMLVQEEVADIAQEVTHTTMQKSWVRLLEIGFRN